MIHMVKKKREKKTTRLSTAELGDLLGCSKNAVVRQAKRYQWKKVQARNLRGQLVTTYSMTEIKKVYPDIGKEHPLAEDKVVTRNVTSDYETPELVEAVQMMVREYIEIQQLTVEAQEKAVQRIVKVFAANIGIMLVLAITAGLAFWQWHNSELQNMRQLQYREAQVISVDSTDYSPLHPNLRHRVKNKVTMDDDNSVHLTDVAMRADDDAVSNEAWPEE